MSMQPVALSGHSTCCPPAFGRLPHFVSRLRLYERVRSFTAALAYSSRPTRPCAFCSLLAPADPVLLCPAALTHSCSAQRIARCRIHNRCSLSIPRPLRHSIPTHRVTPAPVRSYRLDLGLSDTLAASPSRKTLRFSLQSPANSTPAFTPWAFQAFAFSSLVRARRSRPCAPLCQTLPLPVFSAAWPSPRLTPTWTVLFSPRIQTHSATSSLRPWPRVSRRSLLLMAAPPTSSALRAAPGLSARTPVSPRPSLPSLPTPSTTPACEPRHAPTRKPPAGTQSLRVSTTRIAKQVWTHADAPPGRKSAQKPARKTDTKKAARGPPQHYEIFIGAEERTRTSTPLRVHGPEPCASANSATSALHPPEPNRT
jgi:hypothetical protein